MSLPTIENTDKFPLNQLGKTVISHLHECIGKHSKFVVKANIDIVKAVLEPAYRVGSISSFGSRSDHNFEDDRDRTSPATTVKITFDPGSTVDGYLSLYPMSPNRAAQVYKHYEKRKRPLLTIEELTEIARMKRGARLADVLGIG